MAYGIFESTNITGRQLSFVSATDVENGTFLEKGTLAAGSTDIYNGVLPTGSEKVYVVGHMAWNYDNSSIVNQNENSYINKAGKAFRVYEVLPGDRFTIADYGLTGTVDIDNYVGLNAGDGKGVASTTLPSTAFVGKIVRIEDQGAAYFVGQPDLIDLRVKKVTIEVVKNG